MHSRTGSRFILCIVALLVTACSDWSDKPKRASENSTLESRPSALSANIFIPFSTLAVAGNQALPQSFSDRGNGSDLCGRVLGAKVCVGTKYQYTVRRTADLTISRAGDAVRLFLPLQVKGKGGFRGDGCKLLDCDAKNFSAAANVWADLRLSVDRNWCPRTMVQTGYNWTSTPKIEIVGGVNIDIKGQVEGSVGPALQQMGKKAATALTCETVQGPINDLWRVYEFEVKTPGAGPLNARFVPSDIGLTNLSVHNDGLRILVSLIGDITMSTEPLPDIALGDPPLNDGVAAARNRLSLSIPIRASYEDLAMVLSEALVDKPIKASASVGEAMATIRELEVYPTGDDIAIGARLDLDIPGRVLDTSGWVYVTGTPRADAARQHVVFDNIDFKRNLDSDVWQMLSVVLQERTKRAIAEAAVINYAADAQSSLEALERSLESMQQDSGISVAVSDLVLSVDDIVLEDDTVAILASATADVSVTLSQLK